MRTVYEEHLPLILLYVRFAHPQLNFRLTYRKKNMFSRLFGWNFSFGSDGTYERSFKVYGIIGKAGCFEEQRRGFALEKALSVSDHKYRKARPNCAGPVYATRSLRGHVHPILASSWSLSDPTLLVSIGKDCKIFTWDVANPIKLSETQVSSNGDIPMSCAISPLNNLVACGGLGNVCHVLNRNLQSGKVSYIGLQIIEHEGYISSCAFLSDALILTGSGDCTCKLFDVNMASSSQRSFTHASDVLAIAPRRHEDNSADEFFSAADNMICHWDMRERQTTAASRRIIMSRPEEVTSLDVCKGNGNLLACGTNSGDSFIYDVRGDTKKCVMACTDMYITQEVSSVAMSYSGDYLFVGYRKWVKNYMDSVLAVFDISCANLSESDYVPIAPSCVIGDNGGITSSGSFCYSHQHCSGSFVSSVQLNCDGCALAVASHDGILTIFRQQR